jgi:hypothetical protein
MTWWLVSVAFALEGRIAEVGGGGPVSNASVQCGTEVTSTDGRGRFTLEASLPCTLQVTSTTHIPQSVEVADDRRVRMFLEPRAPALEIVIQALAESSHPTRHLLDSEVALNAAGNYEDAVRLVQSLPGVAVQREYGPSAGALYVRGSTDRDSRYFLDGVELPYLYHFNQYASVFPASQVDTLELLPSTFGASYGDAIGAIVDARSNRDRPDDVTGHAMLNFVIAGGAVEVPLPRGWSVTATGRRSYQDLVGEQTNQYTLWPIFHDASLTATHTSGQQSTSAYVMTVGDRYQRAAGELDTLDPVEGADTPQFDFQRHFEVAGFRHQAPHRRVVAAVVHDWLSGELTAGGSQRRRTVTATSRGDLDLPISNRWLLRGGWELRQQHLDLEVVTDSAALLVAEEAPALARGVNRDATSVRLLTEGYGEATHRTGSATLFAGARVGMDTAGDTPWLSPRLAMQINPTDATLWKVAVGHYQQRPATEHLLDDPALPTTESWQIGGGVEHLIAGRMEVHLDGYAKRLIHPLLYPVDGPAIVAPHGVAYGMEWLTRYRIRDSVFLWGWVGVGRSELMLDGDWVPSDADQPVAAGAVISWFPGRGWNLGLRYRGASGLPWTPVGDSLYDATHDDWQPAAGAENSARMPAYHKVDARASKTWTFARWELVMAAEVWVVPPASARLYPTYSFDYRRQGWVTGPSVLPLLTSRAQF